MQKEAVPTKKDFVNEGVFWEEGYLLFCSIVFCLNH